MSEKSTTPPGGSTATAQESADSSRRLDIQGLRAVAVLAVIAFHAGLPLPGGFVGVDVFFVVSGYVITAMLRREFLLNGRIRFLHFYARRFRRLTPALALMVTVTVVLSVFILSPLGTMQTSAQTGIGATLFAANIVIARTTGGYFDAPAEMNPLLNTWSLSVEEQFYFVFPVVLLIGWLIARKYRRLRFATIFIVLSVSLLSLFFAVVTSQGGIIPHFPTVLTGFYSTVLRFWEFGFGAALALTLPIITRIPARFASLLGLLGALGLVISFVAIHETPNYPGIPTLLPTLSTALLLVAGTAPMSPTSRVLSSRPMAAIGDASYSLYLWHWPFIVFAAIIWPDSAWIPLAAAFVSVLPAVASYRWLESPIRQLRHVSRPQMLAIVSTCLLVPLAVCTFVLFAAQHGFWNSTVQQFQLALSPHAGEASGCITKLPVDERNLSSCTWNSEAVGKPIYLVGDSNAEHFSEAAIAAGYALDRPVTIVTSPSCPLIDVHFSGVNETEFSWCRDYLESTLSWLTTQSAGTVIWAAADEYWWDSSIAAGMASDSTSTDENSKSAVLRAGLASVVQTLKAHGDSVILVPSVPHFRYPEPLWDSSQCSLLTLISNACSRSLPKALIAERQAGARVDIQAVANSNSAVTMDLNNVFCDGTSCATARNRVPLYRDWSHISVPTSQSLEKEFTRRILQADSLASNHDA